MKLSDLETGYLAGVVDGEGCITINKKKAKGYAFEFRYVPVFKVTNTNLELLNYIHKLVGSGSIIPLPNNFRGRKRMYQLDFYANTQRWLLPLLAPLLKCKRQQADLVIELLNLTNTHVKRHYRDEHRQQKIEGLYQRIKKLNHRGLD